MRSMTEGLSARIRVSLCSVSTAAISGKSQFYGRKTMDLPSIIALCAVGVCLIGAIVWIVRHRGGGCSDCPGNCAGCSGCAAGRKKGGKAPKNKAGGCENDGKEAKEG